MIKVLQMFYVRYLKPKYSSLCIIGIKTFVKRFTIYHDALTIIIKGHCLFPNTQYPFDYHKMTIDYYKMTVDYYKMTIDYYKVTIDYYKVTIDYYKVTIDYYKMTIDYCKIPNDYFVPFLSSYMHCNLWLTSLNPIFRFKFILAVTSRPRCRHRLECLHTHMCTHTQHTHTHIKNTKHTCTHTPNTKTQTDPHTQRHRHMYTHKHTHRHTCIDTHA